MMHNTEFFQEFMNRYNYPEEAVNEFTRVLSRLDDEPGFASEFDSVVNEYMFPETSGLDEALTKIDNISEKYSENKYTLDFVFLLCCVPILKERYEKAGIDEKIFYDSMDDFRCKLLECIECEGVPGTFVASWYDGFFRMTRFAYGRFQFELGQFGDDEPFTTSCGKVLNKGDTYVNFHIPSSGIPLTDEIRYDSYKKAYPHFKHLFPDGKVIFGCGSWLLYPKHREFLPPHLNILKFMNDFELVNWSESDSFSNDWRVFGRYSDLPYEELPRDTSLRKAYAEWLTAGNKAGRGFGCFVFDGEKIVK